MPFVDEITLHIKAGDGGHGVVRWLHEKNREFGGPSGGDGGRGGSVYAVAVRNVNLLARYKIEKRFIAERGENGKNKNSHGKDGKDLEIAFPVGSIITNKKTGEKISLLHDGQRVLLLKGGRGGRGNESFKSSTNQTPKKFTRGSAGEETDFFIEVELVADIGLIGLPNAGKTTLLNAMTNARGKVGDYAFTTLEPNLGEAHRFIIADIPGLIEGAAEGRGLGHKFLRHIRRTKILAHLISLESTDVAHDYMVVRKELERFDPALTEKKEIVVLTKTDLLKDSKKLAALVKTMKKLAPLTATVSMYDDREVQALKEVLIKEVAD